MNREQQFNQQFVQAVKSHPCLYDQENSEYRNRFMIDSAWKDVAAACGESEAACRRRWRNLKTSTARYLKQRRSGVAKDMKKYYLYEDMKFIIPHLKPKDIGEGSFEEPEPSPGPKRASKRKIKTSPKVEKVSSGDDSYQYEIIESVDGYIVTRPMEEGSNPSVSDKDDDFDSYSHQDVAEVAPPPVKTPKLAISAPPKAEPPQVLPAPRQQEVAQISEIPVVCPDELFLKSLLPDISGMTKEQKRKFKIGVLRLVDDILSA